LWFDHFAPFFDFSHLFFSSFSFLPISPSLLFLLSPQQRGVMELEAADYEKRRGLGTHPAAVRLEERRRVGFELGLR
jgi:hypothetical protein